MAGPHNYRCTSMSVCVCLRQCVRATLPPPHTHTVGGGGVSPRGGAAQRQSSDQIHRERQNLSSVSGGRCVSLSALMFFVNF